MKQRTKRLAAACIIALSVFSTAIAERDEASEQQARLEALQAAIASARQQLQNKTSSLSQVEQAVADTEKTISQLSRQRRLLNQNLKSINSEIKRLQTKAAELNLEIDEQKQYISEQLVDVYKRGNRSPIQLLLDSGSPADFDRQLVYLERLNRARMALLKEFQAMLEQQQQLEVQQSEQQQQLVAARDELDDKEKRLEQAQRQRREQLAELNRSIANDKSRLQKMQVDRDALEALLEEMTAALDADESNWSGYQPPAVTSRDFLNAKGKLPWPIDSRTRKHERDGMSLPARKGTEVKAIYSGRIIFADWFRGQGLLIILDHGNNYWTLYGHNESLLKSAGDMVVAGEAIATVGNSGGQNTDALYFEIRHKGQPQKPTVWCKS